MNGASGGCGNTLSCLAITVPEGQGRRQKIFEGIMDENFPNFVKTIKPQMQGAQRIKSTRNRNRTTLRYIIIKMVKTSDKDKILETARE